MVRSLRPHLPLLRVNFVDCGGCERGSMDGILPWRLNAIRLQAAEASAQQDQCMSPWQPSLVATSQHQAQHTACTTVCCCRRIKGFRLSDWTAASVTPALLFFAQAGRSS